MGAVAPVSAETSVYREPDFRTPLLDRSQLTLDSESRESLARALTAIALNFPDNVEVSPRARAMGLVLASQLTSRDREIVVGNYHLRRGLSPRRTAHYHEKAEILLVLDKELARAASSPDDEVLRRLLDDVLDELLGGERSRGLDWKGTVEPAPRPLARERAVVRLLDRKGNVSLHDARGRLAELDQEAITIRDAGGSFDTPQALQDEWERRAPYLARRLHLDLPNSYLDALNVHEQKRLLDLLVSQLVDGWFWDTETAVWSEAGDDSGREAEALRVLAALEAFFADPNPKERPRTLLLPTLSPRHFADWMGLGRMGRLLAVEGVTAPSLGDIIGWHQGTGLDGETKRSFAECRAWWPGSQAVTPANLRENVRIFQALESLQREWPRHVSARALWTYANLDELPRVSLIASCEWLRQLAGRVMRTGSAQTYHEKFSQTEGEGVRETLRSVSPRLHREAQPLVSGLHRFIDRHVIPFGRVRDKKNSTARLQFRHLVAAATEWRRRCQEIAESSSMPESSK